MARVNTNSIEGITAASRTLPKTTNTTNTTTLEGILAASNATPATAPAVDTRAALAKLTSGQALTDDEKRALGFPVTSTTATAATITPNTKWTKASTVTTANGPVDVDANGFAADGSKPVAVVVKGAGDFLTRNGFNTGPIPKDLEQLIGATPGILGWKIVTNENGSQSLEVADSENTSKTLGYQFTRDNTGKYVKFTSSASGVVGDNTGTGTKLKTPEQIAADEAAARARGERQSAYDLLYSQFKLYGLEGLVEPLRRLIVSGASPAEFTIELRNSDAYKLRFAANAKRIANGFKAIDEATYLGLEDRYQSIMQNYGLPETYYKKGATGVQEGFEKFIANNVDPVTLEERIMEGVKINQGSKALIATAKQFYPSLTDGDFLAYALDPKNALSEIRRKVTATEIGSAQIGAGLAATVGGAEELARAGITGKQYQQAAPTIAEASIRGGQLADIYKQSPYTQQTAEQALLDLPGSAEALRKTKKLTSLETAQFGGSAGAGAIARDRAGVL